MIPAYLNRLGEWNPQLFRELKGRLTSRNLIIVTVSSFVVQLLVVMSCFELKCIRRIGIECITTEWNFHWLIIFRALNWMIPLFLVIAGVNMLINDLAKEENRGTLNFIRLSPESSEKILMGKLLGVPALLYLGVGLTIPLHLLSALAGGVFFGSVISLYALWLVTFCLFYVSALLMTLMGITQENVQSLAGGGSLLAGFLATPVIGITEILFNWENSSNNHTGNWQWFFFPSGDHWLLPYSLILIVFSWASYWAWQAVNRYFRFPQGTLLNKQQSYWLVATGEIWLLGFFWPSLSSGHSADSFLYQLAFVSSLNLVGFLFLIALISPHRQVVQDWASYVRSGKKMTKQSIFNVDAALGTDLIWGERSPALVAIAINLVIFAAIWIPWVLLWSTNIFFKIEVIAGLLLSANLILIYAAIAQTVLLVKNPQRKVLASSSVVFTILTPPFLLHTLNIGGTKITAILLFSPFLWTAVNQVTGITICLGILTQWLILTGLMMNLTRKINKAGESSSKALFAAH